MSVNTQFKLTISEIEKLCTLGGLAPSGGNMQPWKVLIRERQILELKLDEKRSISFLDIGRLASFLALGAFTENVCIAAETFGLHYNLEFGDLKNIIEPMVKITFLNRINKPKRHPLYDVIERRVTNRRIHEGSLINDSVIRNLLDLVKNYDKRFILREVHKEDAKKEVADILGKSDGIRTLNESLFKQMMQEIRWSEEETQTTRDGLDIETLELPILVKKMLRLMKKYPQIRFTLPRQAIEDQSKPVLIGSSHICCLNMNYSVNPTALFKAGQITERIWLTATKDDLTLQPWTVLPFFLIRIHNFKGEGFSNFEQQIFTEVDKKFRKVFHFDESEIPIFIFRLNRAKSPSARALRLRWTDYTEIID